MAPTNTDRVKCGLGDEVLGGFEAVIYFSHSDTSLRTIESIAQRQQLLSDPLSHLTSSLIGESYKIPTQPHQYVNKCTNTPSGAHHLHGGRRKLHTLFSASKANKSHCQR